MSYTEFNDYANRLLNRVYRYIHSTTDVDMIGSMMFYGTQQVKGIHSVSQKLIDNLVCALQSLCLTRISQLEAMHQQR